ncbi:sensor histidine kinase [Flavobacterium sp. HNIBRBA15423]|uniref:sensor histidine kinase n=1 Tax=Flavobacterium sp. HNIBRBA15423 TaxID=3458683 RepID=UPI004043F872
MKHIYLILSISICFFNDLSAQQETLYKDTLYVNGHNGFDLSEYLTFWVDSSSVGSVELAQNALKNERFKHWKKGSVLNLGLNPYDTWLYLKVVNISEDYHQYWWALYSQADSVSVYVFKNDQWQLHTEVTNQTLLKDRSIKTRFPVAEIHLNYGEYQQLLMKITNVRHTQNAITDFTIPKHNLLWEINFYGTIGFFIGCFFLIALLSILFSVVIKELTFLYYGFYLLCIVILMLSEELMIPIVDSPILFYSINRLHSLFLSLIALSLHYKIIVYVIGRKRSIPISIFKTSHFFNYIFLWIAIVYTLIYFVEMESLHFGADVFKFMWYSTIVCIVLSMVNNFCIIIYLMYMKGYFLYGIVLALLLLYFNPAGYFLNYSGIFNYYTITYPNYFYWIVSLEVLFFAIVLAIRYKHTIHNNLSLIKEKAEKEASAILREIEIQDLERRKIAQDLHDDLGTTISAIKLIITNQYTSDIGLKNMITKANNDVRQFFTKLTVSDFNNEKISNIIEQTISNLQRLNQIDFKLIVSGNDTLIPDYLVKPLSRIAVELLLNTIKHSNATEATIQLITDKDQVQLIVEDNGEGFDLQKPQKGMGIPNVYSRTERWGGQVHFSSSQTGTTVIIIIPFKIQTTL